VLLECGRDATPRYGVALYKMFRWQSIFETEKRTTSRFYVDTLSVWTNRCSNGRSHPALAGTPQNDVCISTHYSDDHQELPDAPDNVLAFIASNARALLVTTAAVFAGKYLLTKEGLFFSECTAA
jgi:hypothetical protein